MCAGVRASQESLRGDQLGAQEVGVAGKVGREWERNLTFLPGNGTLLAGFRCNGLSFLA